MDMTSQRLSLESPICTVYVPLHISFTPILYYHINFKNYDESFKSEKYSVLSSRVSAPLLYSF